MEKRNCNYSEIMEVIKKLKKTDKILNLLYFSGEIVPYLILNTNSSKKYSDLNLMCEEKNMSKVREILKSNKLYDIKSDSIKQLEIEHDYGFKFEIDNFVINICPFESTVEGIRQRNYNYQTNECMTIFLPKLKKSDYISVYKDTNEKVILTLSIETIIMLRYLLQKTAKIPEYEECKKIGINKDKLLRINESFYVMEKQTIIPQKRITKNIKTNIVNTNKKKVKKITDVEPNKNGFINITAISSIFMFILAVILLIIYVGKN